MISLKYLIQERIFYSVILGKVYQVQVYHSEVLKNKLIWNNLTQWIKSWFV